MNFGAIGYARSFNDLPVMPDLAFEAKVRTFLSSLRDGSLLKPHPSTKSAGLLSLGPAVASLWRGLDRHGRAVARRAEAVSGTTMLGRRRQ
jgi:hypothetical protein